MTYEITGKNIIDMLIINRRLYNEKTAAKQKAIQKFQSGDEI